MMWWWNYNSSIIMLVARWNISPASWRLWVRSREPKFSFEIYFYFNSVYDFYNYWTEWILMQGSEMFNNILKYQKCIRISMQLCVSWKVRLIQISWKLLTKYFLCHLVNEYFAERRLYLAFVTACEHSQFWFCTYFFKRWLQI